MCSHPPGTSSMIQSGLVIPPSAVFSCLIWPRYSYQKYVSTDELQLAIKIINIPATGEVATGGGLERSRFLFLLAVSSSGSSLASSTALTPELDSGATSVAVC